MCLHNERGVTSVRVCVSVNKALDVDSPEVRWVRVARGNLWALRLPSGQTYPAVLLVQPHRQCPVGRSQFMSSHYPPSDPN